MVQEKVEENRVVADAIVMINHAHQVVRAEVKVGVKAEEKTDKEKNYGSINKKHT
jgi:ABC-type nitrate/sulfonate/bicarbonate transport system ATPase subunit